MGKLHLYARKSNLLTLNILLNTDKYNFNLFEELKISEEAINKEIKEQPSSYAFLTFLHKQLVNRFELLEAEKERVWHENYILYKDKKDSSTGRGYSDEYSKAKAETNRKYQIYVRKCIKAKTDMDNILSAIRAFEQRKDMIQTLSANLRKENT